MILKSFLIIKPNIMVTTNSFMVFFFNTLYIRNSCILYIKSLSYRASEIYDIRSAF
ncbi:hypothetical protein C2G38_2063840 [Gigaspora rosea]|uniref:Uncharacterized protein n=1 Tax=Gigaspora rosea TaxID=44941 RepID=A0A397VXX4_9GLOM|nr:hypothetical protein C2G38_2063840 [Gigaspora rosea]